MKKLDLDELATFLIESNKLLLEAELISEFFPDIKIYNITKTELYHIHFTLFHHLYKLKPILEKQNMNLQIHFMRIGIVDNIKDDEERINDIDSQQLDIIDSLAQFYLDEANYDFFSEEILENWHNSLFYIVKNNDYYHEALKLLMITEDFTISVLKVNYRKLAKQYHPDLNPTQSADYQKFLDINRAYQFLLRCIP